jgi:hypothetical protein
MATEKPRYRSSYTGPVSNRQVIGGKAVVSKEELADFKRQFGKDMTLRDLLNMDKDEFALARQAKSRGAYRGMRSEEPAKKAPANKEEDSGMMSRLRRAGLTAKGAEEAGGLSSSAMAALGIAGGAAGRTAKSASASGGSVAPALRAEFEAFKRGGVKAMEQERRSAAMAKRAEGPATPLKSTNVTSETGRRFTPKQETEAAEAAVRGAAARKEMAAKRAGRSRAMEEAKTQRMMRDEKKKPSPRARTREKEDIEFSYGGMAKKRK